MSLAFKLTESIAQGLATVVWPPACGVCDHPLPNTHPSYLCQSCRNVLERNQYSRCPRCELPGPSQPCSHCRQSPPPWDQLRVPFLYGGPVATLIKRFKFQNHQHLGPALGQLILTDAMCQKLIQQCDAIVPIALSRQRQRQRGYNQSSMIAKILSRQYHKPIQHVLKRPKNTLPQSQLLRQQRQTNLANAFTLRRRPALSVLLIDDVMTTGQTLRHACKTLRIGGTQHITAIAMARVESQPGS